MTVTVTSDQVARSVFSSDVFDTSIPIETVTHVVDLALRQIGFVGVVYERLLLDLPNGLKLEIKPCK